MAAGRATLRRADTELDARIDDVAGTIAAAATSALTTAGVPHVVQRAGNLFSVFMGAEVTGGVCGFAAARAQDTWRYSAFFHAMLDAGVSLPPSAFEAWFVNGAHDSSAIDRVLAALPAAARAAAKAKECG